MAFDFSSLSSPSSAAKDLRWQAIRMLCWMLPKPYNFNSYVGFGMRKLRLEKELAQFQFLHRLRHRRPANLDEIYCAGIMLIAACKGRVLSKGWSDCG